MESLSIGYVATRLGPLHWRRCGSGHPALLLPGASQSHNHLAALAGCLARARDVLVLDMPGSGYGAPLPVQIEFAEIARAVGDAVDALVGGPVLLYGIHTGNKIGASLAVQRPELIEALVLCGQSHSLIVDKAMRTAQMRRVAASRFAPEGGDAAFRALRRKVALWRELEAMWFTPAALAGGESDAAEARGRAGIADLLLALDSLPALYEANFRYDLGADLTHIAAPTLVVEIATPREDAEIGRQAGAVAALVPGARTTVFEEPDGLGLTLEDRAGELAECILAFAESHLNRPARAEEESP